MYRKLVYPLSKRMMQQLMKLYQTTVPASMINDAELFIGRLYKDGLLQIKKEFENGNFHLFISLTDAGKELLKPKKSPLEPAL